MRLPSIRQQLRLFAASDQYVSRSLLVIAILCLASCMSKTQRALNDLERNNIIYSVEDFVAAAGRGDLETIDLFLTAGMDADSLDVNGYTAMMLAAEQGNTDVVKRLLERKASPNVQGIEGATALIQAAFHNRPDTVEALLAAGADPALKDEKGWTAFMKAVYQGRTRIVEKMIPISNDQFGRALMVASIKGHVDIVHLLLSAGVAIDEQEKGQTPLMMAASRGNEEIVRLLLNRGAQPLLANPEGRTASMIAMIKGHKKTARVLQEAESGKMPDLLPAVEPDPVPSPSPTPDLTASATSVATPSPEAPIETATATPTPTPSPSEPPPEIIAAATPTPAPFPDATPPPELALASPLESLPPAVPDASAASSTSLAPPDGAASSPDQTPAVVAQDPSPSPLPSDPPPTPSTSPSPEPALVASATPPDAGIPGPVSLDSPPPLESGASPAPTPYAVLPDPPKSGGSSIPRNADALPSIDSLGGDVGGPTAPVRSSTMRLIEFHENQLPILLMDIQDGIGEFRSLKDSNELVYAREGDTIDGTTFRVSTLRTKRIIDKEGNPVDASEARVRDTKSGTEFRLVKGLPARAAESYALIAVAGEGEPIKVRENEEFSLPGDVGTIYRVLDLRDSQAVIQVVDSGETITVMK
jgi:ankyrin repeat protein